MSPASILENLFLALPSVSAQHAPSSKLCALLKSLVRREIESLFSNKDIQASEFKPFGDLIFPYHQMGAVDSLNLFDLDELIIFSFYWLNRQKYQRVLDVGANIGLHSILLSKCGFEVCAYEPYPQHFAILQRNLALNSCAHVQAFNAAVSSKTGVMEFVRVLGNTTGSHLAGAKPHPYGDLERFPVNVEAIAPLITWADLIKLDAEGHEKDILLATQSAQWLHTDAFVEVGNKGNAAAIYEHFTTLGVQLFSQKIGWQHVQHIDAMPESYREGALFITCKKEVPWYGSDEASS